MRAVREAERAKVGPAAADDAAVHVPVLRYSDCCCDIGRAIARDESCLAASVAAAAACSPNLQHQLTAPSAARLHCCLSFCRVAPAKTTFPSAAPPECLALPATAPPLNARRAAAADTGPLLARCLVPPVAATSAAPGLASSGGAGRGRAARLGVRSSSSSSSNSALHPDTRLLCARTGCGMESAATPTRARLLTGKRSSENTLAMCPSENNINCR